MNGIEEGPHKYVMSHRDTVHRITKIERLAYNIIGLANP